MNNSQWFLRVFLWIVMLAGIGVMGCHDVIEEPDFELLDLPEVPDKKVVSLSNHSFTLRTFRYEGDLIKHALRDTVVITEYDYEDRRLSRRRQIVSSWQPAGDHYYTYRPYEVESVSTGRKRNVIKTWTSPGTYEELITQLDVSGESLQEIKRYKVEGFKPVSAEIYEIKDGEEVLVGTEAYFYKQEVLNPFFGRYGNDIFQPLWLPSRILIHRKYQTHDAWYRYYEEETEYEVDDDLFPISFNRYWFEVDVAGSYHRKYRYEE